MQYLKNIIIALTILLGLITFAQSETSWIKKKNKTETVENNLTGSKVEKEKTTTWIKKKEIKENKKKLKEKIKESKSWITKKSKEKVKVIKKKLKKHKNIEDLPKAELYFAAIIAPDNAKDRKYIYGYIDSDKKSDKSSKFNFKKKTFYSHSDGIVFFDDKETTCEIDTLKGILFDELKGKAIITCDKKKVLGANIDFENDGNFGIGNGEYKGGKYVEIEFFKSKEKTIAKLSEYKEYNNNTIIVNEPDTNPGGDLDIQGKYYALLIGNSKYNKAEWTSLTSPVNDVNEIEKILKSKFNFEEVITIQNADRDKMFSAFEKLSELTTDNDYVLIYYAGHGDIKGNKSYWIPVDGQKKSIRNWINLSDIENYLLDIPAHHLAVMVDSCYFSVSKGSNMINEKQKTMLYQKLINKRARLVLSSGQNEPVDDTGVGKHSIFGMSFINSLKNNNVITLRDIGNNIALAHAGMRQQPYLHLMYNWGHTNGDFIFISKK
tara:strand:- start:1043 stop:2518 length:1476 start_codon:yes stop_codon:yes gene_type:complete